MKSIFRKVSLLVVLVLAAFSSISAQKFGHIDYAAILKAMPETERADKELKVLEDQLTAQAESKKTIMQKRYQEVMEKAQRGELTPKQEQEATAEIQKMQEELEKFAQEADKNLAAKRELLLKPLLSRVDDAVKAVAKEKGLNYILDVTTIFYNDGSNDLTADIKKKLGIQ